MDGRIPKPKLPDDIYSFETNAWKMVNSMIKSYIMNVIDPKLHASVAMSNRRMLCWRILANDIQFPVCPEFINLNLKLPLPSEKSKTWSSSFVGSWVYGTNLTTMSTSSYCMCGAAEKIAKFVEEDKVHQFLMGLDDEYNLMPLYGVKSLI